MKRIIITFPALYHPFKLHHCSWFAPCQYAASQCINKQQPVYHRLLEQATRRRSWPRWLKADLSHEFNAATDLQYCRVTSVTVYHQHTAPPPPQHPLKPAPRCVDAYSGLNEITHFDLKAAAATHCLVVMKINILVYLLFLNHASYVAGQICGVYYATQAPLHRWLQLGAKCNKTSNKMVTLCAKYATYRI